MATLTRCDSCKKLSDDKNVGPIGKEWQVKFYKDRKATIKTEEDLCQLCVKLLIEKNNLHYGKVSEYD